MPNDDQPGLSTQQRERVARLVEGALQHSSAQRAAYIAANAGDDEAVRSLAMSIVERDQSVTSDLPEFPDSARDLAFEPAAQPGQAAPLFAAGMALGPYTLRERLGRGGFGEVWRAERREPDMTIAIKVVRPDRTDKSNLARFAAESQALALLDHPHIAKIHDAGVTDDDVPYLAMEYVQGVSLHEYCDRERLTIKQRLELMAKICDAVHHAHTQGLIHRDLSPDNILVTIHENTTPEPKIVDFGIAKAVNKNLRLTEQTLTKDLNTLIGKPAYMAPEQAEAKQVGVDTRTDIFSLGVILYEMLTGMLPIATEELREQAIEAVLEMLRGERPDPSTRILSLTDEQSRSVAERRRLADPHELRRLLRGRVQHLPMKALRVDRTKRFTSAAAMAVDIRNYLEDKDYSEAAAEPWWDKAQRHVRRHTFLYAPAVLVILAMMAGIVGTTWGMRRAVAAEGRALIAQTIEAEQRRLAEESEQRAIQSAQRAEREAERALAAEAESEQRAGELELVAEFQVSQLADIETELMGIGLRRGIIVKRREFLEARGMDEEQITEALAELESSLTGVNFTNIALETLDENIFERALKAINGQFADQPLIRARLLQALASSLHRIGLLDSATAPQSEALDIRRQMLGGKHPDTLTSLNNYGALLQAQGKFAEAESIFREVLETRRLMLGNDHEATLTSISNMGGIILAQGRLAEAEPWYHEALAGSSLVLGDEHPETLISMHNLGYLLHIQNRFAEAHDLYQKVLEVRRRILGNTHADTLISMNNMCSLLSQQGKYAEAEIYCREALEGYRRTFGDGHPATLTSISNMGLLLLDLGRSAEAETFLREVLNRRRVVLGHQHPDTLTSINNMGFLLRKIGQTNGAEILYRDALETRRDILGNDHIDTLSSINNMCVLLQSQGRFDEAEPYCREALGGYRSAVGDEHLHTLASINNMCVLLQSQGKFDEAEPYCREFMEISHRVFGEDHPHTLVSINSTARLLQSQGKFDEAEILYRHVLETRLRVLGKDHPDTLSSINGIAELLWEQGEFVEAEPYFREILESRRRVLGNEHPDTLISIGALGTLLRRQGQLTEAEGLGAEAVETAQRILPEGHWHTGVFLAGYGRTLSDMDRFAEAELRMLKAYQIFKAALGPEHDRTIGVSEHLAGLYDSWHEAAPGEGYDATAAEWRTRLETSAEAPHPHQQPPRTPSPPVR